MSKISTNTKVDSHYNKNLIFLASYPKSGNTWVRSFILALLTQSDININSIPIGLSLHDRNIIEKILGINLADFNEIELKAFRREAYIQYNQKLSNNSYLKIHDAYDRLDNKLPLFPSQSIKKVVYIVRNPLDVAISYSHQAALSINQSIKVLANINNCLLIPKELDYACDSVRQWTSSWSNHYLSWQQASDCDILITRYEDMVKNPLQAFTEIAHHLEPDAQPQAISNALEAVQFNKLRQQEDQHGFGEAEANRGDKGRFFRKGIVGDWQETLTSKQVNTIINDHKDVMQQLGYLNEHGKPTALICNDQ